MLRMLQQVKQVRGRSEAGPVKLLGYPSNIIPTLSQRRQRKSVSLQT